jgi:fermentation-respiration switch protein FrsA (DUF1100 family)
VPQEIQPICAELAENGFVTIAFDASYQGESTGEPRQAETEEISAVIDYLTTHTYVDSNRIRAMDRIYTANAAINARRIKAVGTVGAVNIGSMLCHGWDNNVKSAESKWMSDDLYRRAAGMRKISRSGRKSNEHSTVCRGTSMRLCRY